jgi:hypothetical protein
MLLKILFFILLYFTIKNLIKGYLFFQKIQSEHSKSFQQERNKHDNNSDVFEAEYKVVD